LGAGLIPVLFELALKHKEKGHNSGQNLPFRDIIFIFISEELVTARLDGL
jgi:hypothetical protein